MASAQVFPSAPAEVIPQPRGPRDILLFWYSLATGAYGSSPPTKVGPTFNSCCGSQIMNEKGEVNVSGIGWMPPPTLEDGVKYYQSKYGQDAEKRFGVAEWKLMLARFARKNKPGVTLAHCPLDVAMPALYDGEAMKFAEGYEINDPEHGTISVLWLNA